MHNGCDSSGYNSSKDRCVSTNPFDNPNPNPYQAGSTPGYPPPQQGSSGLAIASLVCGIVGIIATCCCGLFGIPLPLIAIVTGGMALANPNAQGKGMAMAGVVMGGASLLLIVLGVIIMLLNPDFAKQLEQMKQMQR
jgi:hypothetical protein